jgi:hypothetical protein
MTAASAGDFGSVRIPVGAKARPGPDERAVDGRRGRVEDAGDLGRREAEHVPQHQDRSLLGRQVLQASHERQRDGLPRVIPRLGAGGRVVEQHVRERLEPPRVGQGGGLRPAGFTAEEVEAAVGGDLVQPGSQRAPVELADCTPCGQQSLLKHVLGIVERAEGPVAVRQQFAPVGVDELAEGLAIPGLGTGEGCLGHGRRSFRSDNAF